MPDPSPLLAAWNLSAPQPLKQEGHAHVWRVTRADGGHAALKIFLPGRGGNERNAARWHRRHAASGLCPDVLAERGDAVLYDWAPGQSLGDLFRGGAPDTADEHLGKVMTGLHAAPADISGPFAPLAEHARALTTFTAPLAFTEAQRADIARAADLHARLIASQPPDRIRLLHGDLHHDNVLGAGDTWAAIDPKAVVGDAHFEPANAFRNPTGARAAAHHPDRIRRRADLWAAALDLDRARLLQWAAAKCALSIAWSCSDLPCCDLPRSELTCLDLSFSDLNFSDLGGSELIRSDVSAADPAAPLPEDDLALLPVLLALAV